MKDVVVDRNESASIICPVVDWELDTVTSSKEAEETTVEETEEEQFLGIRMVLADIDEDISFIPDRGLETCADTNIAEAEVELVEPEDEELTHPYFSHEMKDPEMIPLSPLSTSIIFTHQLLLLSWLYCLFFQT